MRRLNDSTEFPLLTKFDSSILIFIRIHTTLRTKFKFKPIQPNQIRKFHSNFIELKDCKTSLTEFEHKIIADEMVTQSE